MKRTVIGFCCLLLSWAAFAQQCKVLTADSHLTSSLINTMCQDCYGSIWIGTENGLNCFDGVKTVAYKHEEGKAGTLAHNVIRAICEDRQGNLYIGTQGGIQLFDREHGNFSPVLCDIEGKPFIENVNRLILRNNGEVWESGNRIVKIVRPKEGLPHVEYVDLPIETEFTNEMKEDSKGNLWVSKLNNGLYRLSPAGTASNYILDSRWGIVNTVCEDDSGDIYVGTNERGVWRYDSASDQFKPCLIAGTKDTPVTSIVNVGDGHLCVCTDNKGAFLFDTATQSASPLEVGNSPFDPEKLKIHAAMKDNEGNIWLGAYQKGVLMVPQRRNNFQYIGSKTAASDIIGSCCVTSVLVDRDRNLWVGTDNDGIYKVRDGASVHYPMSSSEDGIPGTVFDLYQDEYGFIWFGSYTAGLRRMDPSSGKCVHSDKLLSTRTMRESVYAIEEDADSHLWIGTMGMGLYYINVRTMEKIVPQELNSNINHWVTDLLYSKTGKNLYVSTYEGVYKLAMNGESPIVAALYLPRQIAYCLKEIGGRIYIGTANGLAVLDPSAGDLRMMTREDGLVEDAVYALESDAAGHVWISTAAGMSDFNPQTGTFVNYYVGDGLQGNEFYRGSSTDDGEGTLYFGGTGGVTYFRPEDIINSSKSFSVKITGFELPDGSLNTCGVDRFDVRFPSMSCTVEFCTVEYDSPEGILYGYSFDENVWHMLPLGIRNINLSSLHPGKHVLKIKAMDNGVESDPLSVTIFVHPSVWASWPMIVLYALLILAAIAVLYQRWYHHQEEKKEMEQHIRAEELGEEKLRLFTNLSHEIRTPMSLIDGPLRKLMDNDPDPSRQKIYSLMSRNTRRILILINQMLDIRKMEKGQMSLHFEPVDYVAFVEDVCSLFKEQAQMKKVNLDVRYSGFKNLEVWLDPGNFDKVLINLMSNAFKYTPEGGTVTVSVSHDNNNALLTVSDNGPGIPKEDIGRIFDRFYQSANSASGTGIGLNLALMMTELHHGAISVNNNQDGPGCTFSVLLPLGNAHLSKEELEMAGTRTVTPAEHIVPVPEIPAEAPQAERKKRKTILIAEDDSDIRSFLQGEFKDEYNVYACDNGKSALETILRKAPDLLISDVMMPQMDGFTLCRKIRKNINVNSLPIILLTAKTLDEDRIDGLESGADAYIPKPFNIDVLHTTVDSLIAARERLKLVYSDKQVEKENIADVNLKTPDEKLMDRVNRVINANLNNPELTVEMVAQEVGISRVHLHRKLKELTNQTSRDYIRNIRLHKAADMLSQKKYSIAELSDSVGFSSPASFATAFKELFGETPTEYMQKQH